MVTKEEIENLIIIATIEPIIVRVKDDLQDFIIDELLEECKTIEEVKSYLKENYYNYDWINYDCEYDYEITIS